MVMSSYEIEKKIMKDMESYDEFGGFYSVFFVSVLVKNMECAG